MPVSARNFYELLEVAPAASADEIKKAFRQQIALYHPDKVQHLGKEFQAMAAERAAALTEAYRVLSNDERRAEYDRSLGETTASPSAEPAAAPAAAPAGPADPSPEPARTEPPRGGQFHQERASRDAFVRQAAVGKFRQALDATADCEHKQVAGFDFACVPRPGGLFSRSRGPRLLGRFVGSVDARSVADTWGRAAQWAGGDETCVFLIGSELAGAGELAKAIAEQRRKTSRTAKLTLIPVDARNWDAHIPVDAPPVVKNVLARLRTGA